MAANAVEGSQGRELQTRPALNEIMSFDQQAFDRIEQKQNMSAIQQVFTSWSSHEQHGNDGIYSVDDFLRIDAEKCFQSYGRVVVQQMKEIQQLIRSSANPEEINTVRAADVTDSNGFQSSDNTQIRFLIKGGMIRMQTVRRASGTDFDWYIQYGWKGLAVAGGVYLALTTLEWALRKVKGQMPGERKDNRAILPVPGMSWLVHGNPLFRLSPS